MGLPTFSLSLSFCLQLSASHCGHNCFSGARSSSIRHDCVTRTHRATRTPEARPPTRALPHPSLASCAFDSSSFILVLALRELFYRARARTRLYCHRCRFLLWECYTSFNSYIVQLFRCRCTFFLSLNSMLPFI